MTPTPHDADHFTREQAAQLLHVSERTVDRWRANGKLPGSFVVRGSRRVLIPARSVYALLALLVIIIVLALIEAVDLLQPGHDFGVPPGLDHHIEQVTDVIVRV